jgi:protein-S-isoprenylcysteine O-methyltransferase Ste14
MHGTELGGYAYGICPVVAFSIILFLFFASSVTRPKKKFEWMLIHETKGELLVTDGVHSQVRHPQYAGLFLITIGFLVQWPSLATLIMWPILIFACNRLAMKEEKDVESKFSQEFKENKRNVPAFIPRFGEESHS